jgi:hypothetical protein
LVSHTFHQTWRGACSASTSAQYRQQGMTLANGVTRTGEVHPAV